MTKPDKAFVDRTTTYDLCNQFIYSLKLPILSFETVKFNVPTHIRTYTLEAKLLTGLGLFQQIQFRIIFQKQPSMDNFTSTSIIRCATALIKVSSLYSESWCPSQYLHCCWYAVQIHWGSQISVPVSGSYLEKTFRVRIWRECTEKSLQILTHQSTGVRLVWLWCKLSQFCRTLFTCPECLFLNQIYSLPLSRSVVDLPTPQVLDSREKTCTSLLRLLRDKLTVRDMKNHSSIFFISLSSKPLARTRTTSLDPNFFHSWLQYFKALWISAYWIFRWG